MTVLPEASDDQLPPETTLRPLMQSAFLVQPELNI